jgi:hypothetical protein
LASANGTPLDGLVTWRLSGLSWSKYFRTRHSSSSVKPGLITDMLTESCLMLSGDQVQFWLGGGPVLAKGSLVAVSSTVA